MINIKKTGANFERESLIAPFGFKGKYINELWQTVAMLEGETGSRGIGLGVQSILWSDSQVFANYGGMAGNSIMYLMTEYAVKIAKNMSFETPIDLLDKLLLPVYEYGKRISGCPNLKKTFALNALVPVDNAAWLLYSSEKEIDSFDSLIPEEYRSSLSYRHDRLASVPLITYGVSLKEIIELTEKGYFFFKIKIGSDPDKDGDLDKMLEWDRNRLSEIHRVLKDIEIPYTENNHILYYLDANGRYDSKERLNKFLEHAERIGALDRIILLEEPFPEEYKVNVRDLPVRLVADESAHSDKEALERIELGYGAIALKPIAKTLSMSFKIAKLAFEKGIPCFCADLTVNPVMVDWNKNVAARLSPFAGLNIGVLESNGSQNYKNWDLLKSYHPGNGAKWLDTVEGLFNLDEDFYRRSGCIFDVSNHYTSMFL